MNTNTVELVQSSWDKVVPIQDTAADLFYTRLFELDPSLKLLFPTELKEQKRKLMQTLSVAVKGLSDVESLVPVLQNLGVRHVAYGVLDKHYDTVGAALLWTLRQGLADAFTPDVEAAWTEVYGVVAGVMKAAAAEVTPPPVSPYTTKLVQGSWELVKPISDKAAALFYGRLFETDPDVRPLFTSDLTAQGRKLMQTLSVAVKGLDDLDALVPVLQNLARKHVDYGVKAEHYDTVGAALLWTLEMGLGDAFTDDVKGAWTDVYTLVATTMTGAAYA